MVRRKMLTTGMVEFTNEGQSFVGVYVKFETVPYVDKDTQETKDLTKYTFTNERGTFVLMGGTQVDEGMAYAETGQEIEIVYQGIAQTSAGREVKKYDIYQLEKEEDEE